MNGFGYYLAVSIEFDAFQELCVGKTRKQFKNFLRTIYGKKKDRGGYKSKYKKLYSQKTQLYGIVAKAFTRRFGL